MEPSRFQTTEHGYFSLASQVSLSSSASWPSFSGPTFKGLQKREEGKRPGTLGILVQRQGNTQGKGFPWLHTHGPYR